ncbi:hypothetical protein OAS88_00865 [Planktomarina temperata]|nr:hypothetical protein [Planktomarina temperata]
MSWNEFNKMQQNSKFIKNIINHNRNNSFNYIEDSYFNHVRDLTALTIALCASSKNETVKVLDFGSNITTWVNIQNKIKTQNLQVYIYDPFDEIERVIYPEFEFSITKFNHTKHLLLDTFDIIQYGSVAQYDENFFDVINDFTTAAKYNLFTHTPITSGEEFSDIQPKHNFDRFYHSFRKIIDFMTLKKFELIFKSQLPIEHANIQKDIDFSLKKNVVYANLLFKKIN